MLQTLRLHLGPDSVIDQQSLDALEAVLDSWDADVPSQNVRLSAYDEQEHTRQAFADFLYVMGRVLEPWAKGSQAATKADGEASGQRTKRGVCVDLYDWEVWKDWWWTQIEECFPTFAMSDALQMSYSPCECCGDIFVGTDVSFPRVCFTSVLYGAQMGRQRCITTNA